MLSNKPMSGYEIKKSIDKDTALFWKESFGQVYPALEVLQQNGLIEISNIEKPARGSKCRQVYSITSKGRSELINWLNQSIEPPKYRNELLLKIYFGDKLEDVSKYIDHLNVRRAKLKSRIADINKIFAAIHMDKSSKNVFHKIAIMHLLKLKTAELSWCEDAISILKSEIKHKVISSE